MTPEHERELFNRLDRIERQLSTITSPERTGDSIAVALEPELLKRLARVDRRLLMLGEWGFAIASLYAGYRFYDAIEPQWGSAVAGAAAIVGAIAVGWWLVYHYNR